MIVNELRQESPLNDLLQLSDLARSTFYYYLKYLNTDKYECEKQETQEIYNANKGRYGYHRITIAMRNKGYVINHKTIQKLMKQLCLKGKQKKTINAIHTKAELVKLLIIYLNEISKLISRSKR